MGKFIATLVTAPSEEVAAEIARRVVEEKLAACVNIVSKVRSIYSWQGKVQDDPEVLMIIKTRKVKFDALKDRVLELHPYEVPEVIALDIAAGSESYLKWLSAETA